MKMVHHTWLAALGGPNVDDVRETLKETPTDEFRDGKFTSVAATDLKKDSGGDLINGSGVISDLDSCWKAILKRSSLVDVYGVSLLFPVFVTTNQNQDFVDVSPDHIGRDDEGNPIIFDNDDEVDYSIGAQLLPFTPFNFAVKGTFSLWGTILARMVTCLEKYGGPVFEIVLPLVNVTLEAILTGVQDVYTGIFLRGVVLVYQSKKKKSTEPGLYLSCDIVPSGSLQPVADILRDVFGQEDPAIRIMGKLAKKRDWAKAPAPVEFSLQGQLLDISVQLGGIIVITEMGIEVTGTRTDHGKDDDPTKATYAFSAVVSGSGGIMVPGSSLPLYVKWLLTKKHKVYELTLETVEKEWKDVLGILGLNLKNVKFDASFTDSTKVKETLSLGIHGSVCCGSKVIMVHGSGDFNGNWLIEGDLEDVDVDLTLLEDFYKEVFGTELNDIRSTQKLEFESLQLLVKHDSETGSTLTFEGAVTLNGYTSANATITLSSLGLAINGTIDKIKFAEHFTVESATIDVLINPKNSSGTPYRASIYGIVNIEGVEIKVGLYVDALTKGEPLWTVYGELGDLKLSKFGSAIDGTFLDLQLTNVAVIASNRQVDSANKAGDDPNRFNYPVKKGLQVWAAVAKVDAVSKVTRTDPVALKLCISYEEGKSLTLEIVLPTKGVINFSKSIYSGDITLEAVISSDPHISISAGLFIVVSSQPNPLEFEFTLTAREVDAEGTAAMHGLWKDPFGISSNVQVGRVFLGVKIIYAEFFETGIPESITFGGELKVGGMNAKLLVQVSENPEQDLIFVDIRELDLSNFILFAIDVTEMEIPKVSHKEVLHLNTVHIEYAMANVTVDKKKYAQGLDMDCDVDVFGHNMKVKASIHKKAGISIQGSIQCFYLGPLELSGSKKDTPAELEFTITDETQKIVIDGAVTLSNEIYALSLDVELRPKPVFHFLMKLSFGNVLQFDLEANMIGDIDGAKTKDLDFTLSADFKVEILDFINTEADKYFDSLDQAAQADFKEREKELEEEERAAAEGLKKALADLEKKKEAWDAKREEVMKAYDDKQKEVDNTLEGLRAGLDSAQRALNKAIDACKNALESANYYLATIISDAESAISSASTAADAGLEKARRAISDAQTKLDSIFGDVNRAIDTAQNAVNNAQWYVDQKQKEIDAKQKEYDDAHWYSKPVLLLELGALEAEKLVLEVALKLASDALAIAKAVLDDCIYKGLVSALNTAKTALDDLRKKIQTNAQALQNALEEAKTAGANATKQAKDDLEYAKTKGVEFQAFQKAQDALTTFKNAIDAIMKDVKYALDHILETLEYLAHEAAKFAVNTWYDFINITLAAKRGALELDEAEEMKLNGILKKLVEAGKEIFSVKEVKLSGQLSAMFSDKAVTANIDASVGGEDRTFSLSYTIGEVENFLQDLWAKVGKELKELFSDLT